MHFEKWRAVPYIVTIASLERGGKKTLENGLKGQKTSILTVFGPFLDRRSATAMSSREAWAASALKKNKKTKKHRILRDLEGTFEKWRAVPYIVTIAS